MCGVTANTFYGIVCRFGGFMGLFKKASGCSKFRRVRQKPVSLEQLELFPVLPSYIEREVFCNELFNGGKYVRSSKKRSSNE